MTKTPSITTRIQSIDTVRGLAMVIMALDHVRDYFHSQALVFNPTDLEKTSPAIFLTRWITHFCAITFVMLSGTAIYLQKERKGTKDLSSFLLKRGVWLIFLEVVVLRFGFFFNFYYDMTILTVLWVMGAGMIIMAALIYLSDRVVLSIGVLIVVGHTLVSMISPPGNIFYGPWMMLFNFGMLILSPAHAVIVSYPIVPWLGVMMIGYSLGRLYVHATPEKRYTALIRYGIGSLVLFVVLRLINIYDDPQQWTAQKSFTYNFLSFIRITKNPPSMMFFLMMGGISFLSLAFAERVGARLRNFLSVFGRVPLFYFLVHFYLIHITALILFMAMAHKSFSDLDLHFSKSMGGVTAEGGLSLTWVYVIWIALVILMYPLCVWYNGKKIGKWWGTYL